VVGDDGGPYSCFTEERRCIHGGRGFNGGGGALSSDNATETTPKKKKKT